MRFWIFIFSLWMLASPALAAEKPQSVTLRYQAFWGGVVAADMQWSFDIKKKQYQSHFAMKTKGFVDNLYRLQAEGSSSGSYAKNTPQPASYTMKTVTRKRERANGWSKTGKDGIGSINPADENRVAMNLRANTFDPLSAILKLRQSIKDSRARNSLDPLHDLKLPIYDGRRRFDVMVTAVREELQTVGKKSYKTIAIDLSVRPIVGIKTSDLENWKSSKLEVYFTDDGFFAPVKIVATTSFAPFIINMTGGCVGMPPCNSFSDL